MKFFFSLLISSFFSLSVFAQPNSTTKNDVILQLNGDELAGKVTEFTDDAVKFMYAGETLVYTIKKVDILKITYGSGRIEVYHKPPLASSRQDQPSPSPAAHNNPSSTPQPVGEDHHNKIAILPFGFVKDGQKAADELSTVAQTECFAILSKRAGLLTIIDTRNTNAKLLKAGVIRDNMAGYTMDDLCNILGVEYLVDGTVMVNKGSKSSFTNMFKSEKTKPGEKNNSGYASANSTTHQNFDTSISIAIYNDKGNSMFSQSRKAFLHSQDSYRNALDYVLKRSPIYGK